MEKDKKDFQYYIKKISDNNTNKNLSLEQIMYLAELERRKEEGEDYNPAGLIIFLGFITITIIISLIIYYSMILPNIYI